MNGEEFKYWEDKIDALRVFITDISNTVSALETSEHVWRGEHDKRAIDNKEEIKGDISLIRNSVSDLSKLIADHNKALDIRMTNTDKSVAVLEERVGTISRIGSIWADRGFRVALILLTGAVSIIGTLLYVKG